MKKGNQAARRAFELDMAAAVRVARDSVGESMWRRAVELGSPRTVDEFVAEMGGAWRSAMTEIDGVCPSATRSET